MQTVKALFIATQIRDILNALNEKYPGRTHHIEGKQLDWLQGSNWVAQTGYSQSLTDAMPSSEPLLKDEAHKLHTLYPNVDFTGWSGDFIHAKDAQWVKP